MKHAMSLSRRRLVQCVPGLALGLALPQVHAAGDAYRTSQALMGTQVDITLRGGMRQDMAAAAAQAFTEMVRLADMMSRYRATSALNAVNQMAGIGAVTVPPELMRVLLMAQRAHVLSDGAFDATVGSFSGWRFDAGHPVLPDAATLAEQRAWVNQAKGLTLDPAAGTAYLARRGMRLDLGGIAKLPILQAGMARLQSLGVDSALINGGGDVLTVGRAADRPWQIGLRDPRNPQTTLGSVQLTRGWVAASGDYERFFMHQGQRWHHVLDPRTGYPSRGAHGVALIGQELESINGLGTAIMVSGAAAGQALAQHHAGVDALIVDGGNQIWRSGGMVRRLNSRSS
jgi:FAD:protein FMN transferase